MEVPKGSQILKEEVRRLGRTERKRWKMNKEETKILNMVDEKRNEIIESLRTLVRIPSCTGEEGEIQKVQAAIFKEMGLDVDIWEPDIKELFDKYPEIAQYPSCWQPELDLPLTFPDNCTYEQLVNSGYVDKLNYKGRPNVVGTLKGTGGGRSLILNGHIDTVTVEPRNQWIHDPFGAEIEEGKMYGRGTTDMKGGVTAMTKAVECIIKSGIKLWGDVIIQSVVNEEHAGNGTLACIARGYKADAAIVTDARFSGNIATKSSGSVYWEIKVKGRESHPGRRWREGEKYGISAIEKVPFIINGLLDLERAQNRGDARFSLGIGKIRGGNYVTSTAKECVMTGVVKFTSELGTGIRGIRKVKDLLRNTVVDSSKKDPWLRDNPAELYFLHYDDAYEINPEGEILQTLIGAIKEIIDKAPEIAVSGTDARHLCNQGGIPTVPYGPGNNTSHSLDENIDIEDLITATKVLALAVYRWCR